MKQTWCIPFVLYYSHIGLWVQIAVFGLKAPIYWCIKNVCLTHRCNIRITYLPHTPAYHQSKPLISREFPAVSIFQLRSHLIIWYSCFLVMTLVGRNCSHNSFFAWQQIRHIVSWDCIDIILGLKIVLHQIIKSTKLTWSDTWAHYMLISISTTKCL